MKCEFPMENLDHISMEVRYFIEKSKYSSEAAARLINDNIELVAQYFIKQLFDPTIDQAKLMEDAKRFFNSHEDIRDEVLSKLQMGVHSSKLTIQMSQLLKKNYSQLAEEERLQFLYTYARLNVAEKTQCLNQQSVDDLQQLKKDMNKLELPFLYKITPDNIIETKIQERMKAPFQDIKIILKKIINGTQTPTDAENKILQQNLPKFFDFREGNTDFLTLVAEFCNTDKKNLAVKLANYYFKLYRADPDSYRKIYFYFCEKAAEFNDPLSLSKLVRYYAEGRGEIQKNTKKSIDLIKQLLKTQDHGYIKDMMQYLVNENKALYAELQKDPEFPLLQIDLNYHYYDIEQKKSADDTVRQYISAAQTAAEKGHLQSIFQLAKIYNEGQFGLKQEKHHAAEMLMKLLHSKDEDYTRLAFDYLKQDRNKELSALVRSRYIENRANRDQFNETAAQIRAGKPQKVLPTDLKPNGKLLTDDHIKRVKELFYEESLKQGREVKKIKKSQIYDHGDFEENKSFSVVRIKDGNEYKYYALYRSKHGMKVGSGEYGKGLYAQELDTGKWKLIKKIKSNKKLVGEALKNEYEEVRTDAAHEAQMLTIAGLGHGRASVRYENTLQYEAYLVMDIAPGQSLFNYTKNDAYSAKDKDILNIINNLIVAYDVQIRQKHLIHRDLHAGNIMVDDNGKITIIDYGLSRQLDQNGKYFGPRAGDTKGPVVEHDERVDLLTLGRSIQQLVDTKRNINEKIRDDLTALCSKMSNPELNKRLTYPQVREELTKIIRAWEDQNKTTLSVPTQHPSTATPVILRPRVEAPVQSNLHVRKENIAYVDTNVGRAETGQPLVNQIKPNEILKMIKVILNLQLKERPDSFNKIQNKILECEQQHYSADKIINELIKLAESRRGGLKQFRQSEVSKLLYQAICNINKIEHKDVLASLDKINTMAVAKVSLRQG